MFEDVIDETVRLSFISRHEIVAVGVALDLLDGLPGVAGKDGVDVLLDPQDLFGLDGDVARGALRAAPRLMDHDARVRQRSALSLGSSREEHGGHGRDQGGRRAHGNGRQGPGGEGHQVAQPLDLGQRREPQAVHLPVSGDEGAAQGLLLLLGADGRDAGQVLALDELERGAAAGRHVGRGRRVSASGSRRRRRPVAPCHGPSCVPDPCLTMAPGQGRIIVRA